MKFLGEAYTKKLFVYLKFKLGILCLCFLNLATIIMGAQTLTDVLSLRSAQQPSSQPCSPKWVEKGHWPPDSVSVFRSLTPGPVEPSTGSP